MNYDKKMDEQCVELCDAINEIPGFKTVQSCCGHSRCSYRIWFNAEGNIQKPLYILARSLNRFYGGPVYNHTNNEGAEYSNEWEIKVKDQEVDLTAIFVLESPCVGSMAYRQSKKIASNIREILKSKKELK